MVNEMIVHPRPERFRDAFRSDPAGTITRTLEQQSTRERPDFDVLFGAGQIARQEQVADLNGAIADWLRASELPRRWDLAACFLMGYWALPVRPGPAVAELLLRQLKRMDSDEPGWNELVRALGAAAILTEDSGLADRIRNALRSAVAWADLANIQAGTVSVIDMVLGS